MSKKKNAAWGNAAQERRETTNAGSDLNVS